MTFIPGNAPRPWRRLNRSDLVILLIAVGFGIWFLWRALSTTAHSWDWSALWPYIIYTSPDGQWKLGLLLKGLLTTVRLGLWSLVLAFVIGGLVGALSARKRGLAILPAHVYITLVRNTPPLVLLFLVYFFAGTLFTAPLLDVESFIYTLPLALQELFYTLVAPQGQLDRMVAAVLTLGLYEGAYVAEIVRAGIESVPRAQWEASASQGMTSWQQRLYIIAPQALRLMLPALAGQSLSTFKDTALASLVSLPELTFQSLEVMAVSRITFELWLVTAALYLLLSLLCTLSARALERRQRWRPL